MTRLPFAALVAGFVVGLACGPALAPAFGQDAAAPPPPDATAADNNRYSFHRVQDGFVRLDSRTGQVAQCGWAATGWSCKAAPEDRAALESEIARLQAESAALKKALLSRGIDLPGGVRANPPAGHAPDAGSGIKSPPDAEIDRAIAFMKGVWRRLVELMADLQRDVQRKI
jgi:hypothetical protein